MSTSRQRLPEPFRLAGWDLLLLVLGLAGAVAFGVLLPDLHPDSTVEYEFDAEEAISAADVFLISNGFATDGLMASAQLLRRDPLLSNLQTTLGRNSTVEFLSSEGRNEVAAHFWRVRYHPSLEPGQSKLLGEENAVFEVELAQNRDILAFSNLTNRLGGAQAQRLGNSSGRVNRSALATIIRADSATNSQAGAALTALPDSVFQANLTFDLTYSQDMGPEQRMDLLQAGRSVPLDSTALEELFRFHVRNTAFSEVDLKVDSIGAVPAQGGRNARIRMVSDSPIAGQIIEIEAGVTPLGTLTRLSLSYRPAVETESTVSRILGATRLGLLALLGFGFIIVFFRRLVARLLDMKAALVDAMIVGILGGTVAATSTTALSEMLMYSPLWMEILLRLVVFSVVSGALSVFVFMVAGVTDSVVREKMEGKLGTLVLLRHGDFQNKPMGAALVRGLSLGMILVGIGTLGLFASEGLHLSLGQHFLSDQVIRPVVGGVFESFESAYFLTLLWMVGVSAVSLRMSGSPILMLVLMTASGMFLQAGPVPFETQPVALIVSGVSALVLALAFLRYDVVTALTALFASEILWSLSEGFLVQGSPAWIDALLGVLFLGSVLILGFTGVASKRTGNQVNTYVPEYVSEMAGQERVRRELEIAHQVQSFFLPRTMPEIAGLDISGMCLSANEVGGDYYDFIELDDGRLAFVLGDVSGKGIQAAFFMTLVKGIVQTLSRLQLPPAEIMRRLNTLFCRNAPSGTFISVVYGELDPKSGRFTFARAGHNPVIWYDSDRRISTALRPKGMAIGFKAGDAFDSTIEEATIHMSQGDALVFYTDGFSEAMNRSRALYGDDRLVEKVTQIGGRSASAILRLMTEDVHHFIEGMGRADDMTMAVIKLNAPS
ncbi:MAG: PP2C family protein-serine/threonine phosphatase [Bacteroidetes bacterium]|nr:PP2C family protein-serine/threonine phosphatase [Bacteroidota bacterium]